MPGVQLRLVGLGLLLAGSQVLAQTAAERTASAEAVRNAVTDLPGGRIARPDPAELNAAQWAYVEGILAGPRSAISGPLVVMLASPGLGDLAQRTMAFARYSGEAGFGSVPPRLNELAVIMAAKNWSSPYVWNAHHQYAVSVGVPADLVEAVRTGAPPPADLAADLAAVYAFLSEFLETREVSDATFIRARDALGGDQQLVDLVGTFAIYQMSAMLSAIDRTGLAPGEAPTLRPLQP